MAHRKSIQGISSKALIWPGLKEIVLRTFRAAFSTFESWLLLINMAWLIKYPQCFRRNTASFMPDLTIFARLRYYKFGYLKPLSK
jgi:hypothetical protein